MDGKRLHLFPPVLLILAVLLLLALPAVLLILAEGQPSPVQAQAECFELFEPEDLPAPRLINFDDAPAGALLETRYLATFGVGFVSSDLSQVVASAEQPEKAHSRPNVAINRAVSPEASSAAPMTITFDMPKTHAGLWIGNGQVEQVAALLSAYDSKDNLLCQARRSSVPDPVAEFIGLADQQGRIQKITLQYLQSPLEETIDDLYFSPADRVRPTRTPLPTWTPIPSASPTPGPAATPTPVFPVFPYQPPVKIVQPPLISLLDLSIHGIEVTQGIQCFDQSKGLTTCANNSLPMVVKKDAAARIYLKSGGLLSNVPNVPVRLHIRANNVWYTANVSGRATTTINQANTDSANVYFLANFSNDVVLDFYAIVDPDNLYSETNESNNRFPASGYLTMTFNKRDTMKIVGQRLYYHPSGYTGSQYAGGWAVNGGAADWFEQLLPIPNNGINYKVKSGYLNWTTSLAGGDGQHALIKNLNARWLLENLFFWFFAGDFTGARHVYGWAPNDGYSGGHADMPVYPHAGGYGVVGIGTDRPGTSTDNPGGGALIFGHELVHDYNVLHTNTADACGSSDGNSTFPYSSSSIQEFGFNPFTGKIYDPVNTHDLMSYCPANGSKEGWISPFTWNLMSGQLDASAAAAPAAQVYAADQAPTGVLALTENGASLLVNVTVYNPDYQPAKPGELGHLYKTEAGVSYLPQQGDYAVQLRDAGGKLLYSQPFIVDFESEYDGHTGHPHGPDDEPPFPPEPVAQVDLAFIIPWMEGTSQVVLAHGDQVYDQRPASANPPQVLITNPTTVESWAAGSTHTLTWQGLDLDGDELVYAIFYSHDGGASWTLLQDEWSANTYDVMVDAMAGGSDVRFRVVATDGIHTAYDETDQAITIPNQAPFVTILNPAPGSITPPGWLVVLQGSATDMEDGTLPSESLLWSSDRHGSLGVGSSLPLTSLAPGWHTLSLTATDSNGNAAAVVMPIYIGHQIFLPLTTR